MYSLNKLVFFTKTSDNIYGHWLWQRLRCSKIGVSPWTKIVHDRFHTNECTVVNLPVSTILLCSIKTIWPQEWKARCPVVVRTRVSCPSSMHRTGVCWPMAFVLYIYWQWLTWILMRHRGIIELGHGFNYKNILTTRRRTPPFISPCINYSKQTRYKQPSKK